MGSVFAIACDFFLFSFTQLLQIGSAGAEAQFSIKPERAGINGFIVILADLVGINGNPFCCGKSVQAAQGLGVDPGGFTLAVGVENVEADLDPLA